MNSKISILFDKIRRRLANRLLLIIIVLAITFIAFLITTIISLTGREKGHTQTLNEKAERTTDLIISSNIDNLMDFNITALKTSIDSFLEDKDINKIVIKDGSGAVLINISRDNKGMEELSIKRNFVRNNLKIGSLNIVFTDHTKWEKAERIAELIVSSNIDNIWDYNVEALNTNIHSFFKDIDIASINLKEESGIVLVDMTKDSPGSERVTITRDLRKDNRYLGKVTMVFTNYSTEKKKQHELKVITALFMFTFILGITIVIIIYNLYFRSDKDEVPFHLESPEHDSGESYWTISSTTEEKIKKAISYIEENYTRNISREGLATMLDLNPDNLGRYFKLYSGEKINDFINELRIEDAAKKLIETDENIVTIAFAVGFENISTFNRAFSKLKNITPTEFRKKYCK